MTLKLIAVTGAISRLPHSHPQLCVSLGVFPTSQSLLSVLLLSGGDGLPRWDAPVHLFPLRDPRSVYSSQNTYLDARVLLHNASSTTGGFQPVIWCGSTSRRQEAVPLARDPRILVRRSGWPRMTGLGAVDLHSAGAAPVPSPAWFVLTLGPCWSLTSCQGACAGPSSGSRHVLWSSIHTWLCPCSCLLRHFSGCSTNHFLSRQHECLLPGPTYSQGAPAPAAGRKQEFPLSSRTADSRFYSHLENKHLASRTDFILFFFL